MADRRDRSSELLGVAQITTVVLPASQIKRRYKPKSGSRKIME